MRHFIVPSVPEELAARTKARLRRMGKLEDLELDDPVVIWSPPSPPERQPTLAEKMRDPELDLELQLEALAEHPQALEAGFCNLPSLWPYFGTAVLSSAFGSQIVIGEGHTATLPAFHTPEEALRISLPDLRTAGQCRKVLDRITFYRDATDGAIPIRSPR